MLSSWTGGELWSMLCIPRWPKNASAYNAASKSRVDLGRKKAGKLAKSIPVGSSVMIRDPVRSSKFEPRFLGPYKVVAITKAKTFRLLNSMGVLLPRSVPVSQIKLISAAELPEASSNKVSTVPISKVSTVSMYTSSPVSAPLAQPSPTTDKFFYVDKILGHKGHGTSRRYLVKWHGYGSSYNTWEPFENFEDQSVITRYLRAHAAAKLNTPPVLSSAQVFALPSSSGSSSSSLPSDVFPVGSGVLPSSMASPSIAPSDVFPIGAGVRVPSVAFPLVAPSDVSPVVSASATVSASIRRGTRKRRVRLPGP